MKEQMKMILNIIICTIFIIFFWNISEVESKAIDWNKTTQTVRVNGGNNVSADLVLGLDHVFCIDNGQKVESGDIYTVKYYIKIDGNTSTIYSGNRGNPAKTPIGTVDSDRNAKFAYILSQSDGGSNHVKKEYAEIQKEVYWYMPKWLEKNPKVEGISATGGAEGSADWSTYAENYANQIKDASIEAIPTYKTKQNVTYNGTDYIKVGPFKWEFTGTYTSCNVYDQDNNSVNVKYASYNGTTLNVYNTIGEASKTKKDFYILVPTSVSTISKITATVTHRRKNIETDIWILESGTRQNIISTKSDSSKYKDTTATITLDKEISLTGNIRMQKVDKDNTNIKLSGVKFIIKNEDINKYVKSNNGIITYVDKTQATKFITDSSGEVYINGLISGNYVIYEIENPNYGYAPANFNNPIEFSNGKVKVAVGETEKVILQNKRQHINLSGYVWEDIISTKQSVTNDLYKADSNDMMDQLLQNVTVQLIYKNGNVERVERSAITDSNGKYLFEEVLIDDLPYLNIKFTYNGMSYEAVKKGNISAEKSSKASENGRAIFNSNYKTIEKDKSNAYSLKYDVNNYVSKIHLGDSLQYGYSGATKPVNGVYEQYQISSTVDINEIIQQVYGGNIRSSGIDEIQNINLGLREREMPDLAVVKDLYSSKININSESYTYLYEDRLKAENQNKEAIYNMQPQVKFGQERGNQTYARPIYASDIKFTGVNKLDVKLIYRIGINNQSTNLRITVNQMVDYLDSKFETTSVKIGKGLDADGNITQIIEKSNTQLAAYNNQYSKITINPSLTIEPQSEEMIYIELTVKPENIAQIIDQGIEVKLDNIAEITSYSTQDKNGNIYGGIDKDSQPGNAVPGNTSTYEDDTDKAPGILLVLQEERSVEGSVFEDKVIQELLNSKIRQGSGTYDSGELGISGVQVTVKKENGEIAKVYNSKATGDEEKWVDAITTTDLKGNYYIGGFVPGNYYITFTWGGKEYTLSDGTSKLITVQNYKGTIVNKETYTKNATNEFWYRDEQRNSDAIDDYNIRETIDNDNNMLDITYKSQKQIDTSKTMNSTTPVFKINVEYPDSPIVNTAKVEYETNDDGSLKIENGYLVKKDGYKNTIKNIDFGIVERPRQTLGLEKTVNHIKLVLANGNSIIDADVDEDGNIVGKPNYISYIPKSEETKEQIKLEIDNEIVQGSTIEISYVFKVKNIGEIDYDNTDYYYYGKGYGEEESKKVTLSAIQIIDYLDNEVATDLTNTQWEEITNKNQYLDQGLISENDKMKEYINSVNRIIKTEELKDIKLKPGEEAKPLTIKVSKVLANNEETYLENNAEIIHVKKTGGSNLTTIPGNYIPTDMTTSEADNDEAEIVYIVPPTGIADNIISYVILAISTLAILVSGIILIKRFVIK